MRGLSQAQDQMRRGDDECLALRRLRPSEAQLRAANRQLRQGLERQHADVRARDEAIGVCRTRSAAGLSTPLGHVRAPWPPPADAVLAAAHARHRHLCRRDAHVSNRILRGPAAARAYPICAHAPAPGRPAEHQLRAAADVLRNPTVCAPNGHDPSGYRRRMEARPGVQLDGCFRRAQD
jgi:hypothetical protein